MWDSFERPQYPIAGFSCVAAINLDDVWAGGQGTEHRNGTSRRIVPDTDSLPTVYIEAMSAASPTDVWALSRSRGNPTIVQGSAIEHWDGHSWSNVSFAVRGNPQNTVLNGSVSVHGQTWIVGAQGSLTLVDHNAGA